MKNNNISKDIYWEKVKNEWPHIITAYRMFQYLNPILEYHLPDRKIFAYPATDYINSLSLRTRETTREMYRQACIENEMMVFVRDMEKNILRSYVVPIQTEW